MAQEVSWKPGAYPKPIKRPQGLFQPTCEEQRRPKEHSRFTDGLLHEVVSSALEHIGTDVPADASLMSAGLDSIAATEMSKSLNARFQTDLSPTLLFDHPSLRSVASCLLEGLNYFPPNHEREVTSRAS